MGARVGVVTLDLEVAIVEVTILALVIRLRVVGVERVVCIAPLEDPAVATLLTEVILDVGKILTRVEGLHNYGRFVRATIHVDDGNVKCAAVIGRVALCVHHKGQAIRR